MGGLNNNGGDNLVIEFSQLDCLETPVIVLKNLDETPLQPLGYIFNVETELSYNSISTISFDLPAYVDGRKTPHYDEVVGMRMLDFVGVGQFILVDPTITSDGVKEVKSCKAYSLEYEFSKKNIYLEAGTYNFFSGTNVRDTDTIVGRISEIFPDWSFSIDSSLIGVYRTFEDINKKGYDFIKSDVQESYGCIFNFDTYNRVVYVKAASGKVPTKQQYLSNESLIKKLNIEEDSDGIVTCLDVNGAEGVSIRSVNPTGTNKIYNLDYFMTTTNFSQDLIDRWRKWEGDCSAQQDAYYVNTTVYNSKLLQILTAESKLSDLNADLISLDNIRATTIQGIAINAKTSSDLQTVNQQIQDKNTEIAAQQKKINTLKSEASAIYATLESVNKQLAMDRQDSSGNYVYFTPDELTILRRYFIEDILQDTSFVTQNVATYESNELNTDMNNSSVIISGSSAIQISSESSDTYVSEYKGGSISLSNLNAKIIKATFCKYAGGSAVLTAYLENGKVGDASFNTGTLTVAADGYSISNSDQNSLRLNVNAGRLFFTKNCTEYERLQIEWDLYAYGKEILKANASPKYNFTVDCANFLSMDVYRAFHNQLSLGERIYLNIDGEILEPYVTSIRLKYDDPDSLSIEFSNSYTSFDKAFALTKLLEQSVSLGKTLDYKSGAYSSFVSSGASTRVKEFMESALDIAKNSVLSSGNQAIEFNDAGLKLRKWKDNNKSDYDPEQIWAVNNNIVFTDDNWETAKMAIGKIFDPNFVSDSNPQGYMYGIAAPYIVGTILAGSNLVIESAKKDGDVSVFRVDGNGATLYNAMFDIVNDNNRISLSPDIGIAIGGKSLFTTSNGVTTINEDDAMFWVDNKGNLNIKGTLKACDGTFSGTLSACDGTFSGTLNACEGTFKGTVQASDFLDSNGNSMMNGSKFASGYLDLKGIKVVNNNGETTFEVKNNGNVTIKGDVAMSGSISWSDITGTEGITQDIANALAAANNASGMADSANGLASSAINAASQALNNSTNAQSVANNAAAAAQTAQNVVSGWKYQGTTYIDGTMIAADTIIASKLKGGQVGLLDRYGDTAGWLDITGSSSSGYAIELASGNALRIKASDGDLYLFAKDNDGQAAMTFTGFFISTSANFIPACNSGEAKWDLGYDDGYDSFRWANIYGIDCYISNCACSSDKNKKNSIEYDMQKYEDLFFKLKPTQFKFNEGTGDRYHVGFISQDVGEAIVESGLSTQDFGGFVKAPKKGMTLEADENDCSYYLRYNEFISLNTHMIQKLYKRIELLESELLNHINNITE